MTREWNSTFYPHQQNGPDLNSNLRFQRDVTGGLQAPALVKARLAELKETAEAIIEQIPDGGVVAHDTVASIFARFSAISSEAKNLIVRTDDEFLPTYDFDLLDYRDFHNESVIEIGLLQDKKTQDNDNSFTVPKILIHKIIAGLVGWTYAKAFLDSILEYLPKTVGILETAIARKEWKKALTIVIDILEKIVRSSDGRKKFLEILSKKVSTKWAGSLIAKLAGKCIPIFGWILLAGEIMYAIIAEFVEVSTGSSRPIDPMAHPVPEEPPRPKACRTRKAGITTPFMPYGLTHTMFDPVVQQELIIIATEQAREFCKQAQCLTGEKCEFRGIDPSTIPALQSIEMGKGEIVVKRPPHSYLPPSLEGATIPHWTTYSFNVVVFCECPESKQRYREPVIQYANVKPSTQGPPKPAMLPTIPMTSIALNQNSLGVPTIGYAAQGT